MQDDYEDALHRLHELIRRAYPINPMINFEVLVHKVESLSDEYRFGTFSSNAADTLRDIRQYVQDYLDDTGMDNALVNFYTTSVWDSSVFEVCSRLIQKLIPQNTALENLMDALVLVTNLVTIRIQE